MVRGVASQLGWYIIRVPASTLQTVRSDRDYPDQSIFFRIAYMCTQLTLLSSAGPPGYFTLPRSARHGPRTRSASPRASCPQIHPRRANRNVRRAPRSGQARDTLLDRRGDGPPAFAGIRYAARGSREVRLLAQREGGQVEQPSCHHTPTPPHLGDIRKVEVVVIMFGITQRRRLGVRDAGPACLTGVLQDVESLVRTPPSTHTRYRCAPSSRSVRRPQGHSVGTRPPPCRPALFAAGRAF